MVQSLALEPDGSGSESQLCPVLAVVTLVSSFACLALFPHLQKCGKGSHCQDFFLFFFLER